MTPNKSKPTISPRSPEIDPSTKLNKNLIISIIVSLFVFFLIVWLSANAIATSEHHFRHVRELKKTLGAPPKLKKILEDFSGIVNKPHTDAFGNIYTIRTFYLRDFEEYTYFQKSRSIFYGKCFVGIFRINFQVKTAQV